MQITEARLNEIIVRLDTKADVPRYVLLNGLLFCTRNYILDRTNSGEDVAVCKNPENRTRITETLSYPPGRTSSNPESVGSV